MMHSAVVTGALALWLVLWALKMSSFTALMIGFAIVIAYAAVSAVRAGNSRS